MVACCKVGRLIEEYGLREQGLGDRGVETYLLARWLGEGEYAATGLRPLEDWFNRRLLKTAYNEHGRDTLDARIESEYETLLSDDGGPSLLADLEADGIDGERLQSDFVSTATLYRHFTDCLDASKSGDQAGSDSNWEAEKIDFARGIVHRNVEESLRALENKGRLPGGSEAEIKTEIVLSCPDCTSQVSVERAIERGYICADHLGKSSSLDSTDPG